MNRVKSSIANQGNKNRSIQKSQGEYFSLQDKEKDVQTLILWIQSVTQIIKKIISYPSRKILKKYFIQRRKWSVNK